MMVQGIRLADERLGFQPQRVPIPHGHESLPPYQDSCENSVLICLRGFSSRVKQPKVINYQKIALAPSDLHYVAPLDSVPNEVEHHSRAGSHRAHAGFIESHPQGVVVVLTSDGTQKRTPCRTPPDFIDQRTSLVERQEP